MAIPLAYPVRSLLVRKWTSIFTAGGVALVVTATVLLLALVGGLRRMLASSGEPDNVVVLRKGSTNDGVSQVPRDAMLALRTMPGVARRADGEPLASPELVNQPFLVTRNGGREIVLIRGVEPIALDVHRAVHLVQGRIFRPHVGEVVVGLEAAHLCWPPTMLSTLRPGTRRSSWRKHSGGGAAIVHSKWPGGTLSWPMRSRKTCGCSPWGPAANQLSTDTSSQVVGTSNTAVTVVP